MIRSAHGTAMAKAYLLDGHRSSIARRIFLSPPDGIGDGADRRRHPSAADLTSTIRAAKKAA